MCPFQAGIGKIFRKSGQQQFYAPSIGQRAAMTGTGLWNMPVGVNYKYETTSGGWGRLPLRFRR